MENTSSPRTLIIGHRGSGADNAALAVGGPLLRDRAYRSHVLENTLLSLCEASRAGADMVEFDVQLPRDGVCVIHHDWGVVVPIPSAAATDTTAALRVPVGHLTLAQFKALRPQTMI